MRSNQAFDLSACDVIHLRDWEVVLIVGCLPQERKTPQKVIFNIELFRDNTQAALLDDLNQALDYAQVYKELGHFLRASSFHLIEALAERAAQFLLSHFDVLAVRLSVTKQPLYLSELHSVAATVLRFAESAIDL